MLDDFSQKNKTPHIAISVDMLDTGIDVPEVVIMKIPLLSQSGRADVLAGYLADFLDGGMDHLGSGSGLLRA